MRHIRFAFLAIVAICLITLALANRQSVDLRLLPEDLANLLNWDAQVSVPLFLVVFAGVIAGILIGFFWEWLREHKHRAEAATHRRERQKLEQEVNKLRDDTGQHQDEVLALLESATSKR